MRTGKGPEGGIKDRKGSRGRYKGQERVQREV